VARLNKRVSDIAMTKMSVRLHPFQRWLASMVFVAVLAVPAAASAQVVVLANGSPITSYDIEQRTKLIASSTHKNPVRQEVINDLIDDRLKIAKAKSYGLEVSDQDIDRAFSGMAERQHIPLQQFVQALESRGISANTVKARIRAELTWGQLVRGKFGPSLEVGDSDVNKALSARSEGENATEAVGYIYTLYPIVVVVPNGTSPAVVDVRRREAENLRSRFTSCKEGLALARALPDVAVREPINRSSADLAAPLRELLGKMQIGALTTPDVTAQGLQMFALCGKKETKTDSPVKRELREQIFAKRFENESKRFLDEVRKSAMIEYK
jgi:peptidyl-prolyl cis-trans isomerase SurA